jgi:hypothetical protein
LLLPPQLRKSLQVAMDVGLLPLDHGMDIKKRSIRVKYEGLGLEWHRISLWPTRS